MEGEEGKEKENGTRYEGNATGFPWQRRQWTPMAPDVNDDSKGQQRRRQWTSMDVNVDGNERLATAMAKAMDVNGDGNGRQWRLQWKAMDVNRRRLTSMKCNGRQ